MADLDRLEALARPAGKIDDHLSNCWHPSADLKTGPRVPALYGSWPTQVCNRCGCWRTTAHLIGKWRPKAELLDALKTGEQR